MTYPKKLRLTKREIKAIKEQAVEVNQWNPKRID